MYFLEIYNFNNLAISMNLSFSSLKTTIFVVQSIIFDTIYDCGSIQNFVPSEKNKAIRLNEAKN